MTRLARPSRRVSLAGLLTAALGWSQASALDWTTYKDRLGAQGSRWDALSVNFYRAPEINWR